VVKRVVDVVFSAVLLCLALPLLLLSALVIRMTSPGPVLFRQLRMGRGFRTFEILKLRTMAHAQAGLAYTLGPDPRITPFGKWLRRSKIDELPQLWNVIRGEMSLVGPRPVLPELTAEFRFHYKLLLRARPGLTDPASLKYSQESSLLAQARDPMRFFKHAVTPDKIRISLAYMEEATVWTDLGTLLMTSLICCFPGIRRIYGEVPDPLAALAPDLRPSAQHMVVVSASHLPMDACTFSHELASLEANQEAGLEARIEARSQSRAAVATASAEGEGRRADFGGSGRRLPWNPLYLRRSARQSTVTETRESATHL
jgi:lipopolysaccharide/colanic/teichoic acid biosynthesis glycosyltransferase